MTPKEKSPAFQWYPKDFETDEVAACMSLSERGVYITLLGYCWLEGSIPDDASKLARLCRCSESELRRAWPAVSQKFTPREDGRLLNSRLEKERESQREHSDRRKNASAIGNRKRWGVPIVSQSDTNGNKMGVPIDRSSSSSSSAIEETKNVSSPDEVFNALLQQHPKKAAPNYALSEFQQILSESQDPESAARRIYANHARWVKYWRETGTEAKYVPKLMDWLKGGDWQIDPPVPTNSEPEYPKSLM